MRNSKDEAIGAYVIILEAMQRTIKKCNEWQVVLQKQYRNRTKANQQDSSNSLN
jgi:hypothetical protein